MAVDLVAVEQGSGTPLLILHGLFGSATNWTGIARRLAATHRVFAVDLRNHGRSPWSDEVGYAAQADDLGRFVRRHAVAPATLLGHSMGGKAAMALALREPGLVARLVVVDVAPVSYPPVLGAYAEAMRAIDPRRLARRAEADALLAARIPEAPIRSFLLQNLVAGPEGLSWRLNLDALAAGMAEISGFPDFPSAARYQGPTLFIRGERSDYVAARHEHAIRERFPRAEIVTVAGAGHWVHAERPDAFVQVVEGFVTV
jgi:esterase